MSIEEKLDLIIDLLTRQLPITLEKCKYTVAEWADEWLIVYKAHKLRELTYIKYKGINENYIKPLFGTFKLDELKPMQAQKLIMSIPFSREREHVYMQVKEMFSCAIKNQIIEFNPFLAVEMPPKIKKQSVALTREEEARFIEACKTEKHGLMFIICLYAGLRRGEVLALTYSDFLILNNPPQDTPYREFLRVEKSFNCGKVKAPKTQAGNRLVPILSNLLPYVKILVKNSNDRIFPITEKPAQNHFKNILIKSGLTNKNFTIHSLRHTFITRCYENGIDPKTLAKWVGHTTPSITIDVYTHCNKDFENEQIKNINERLKSI